MKIEYYIDDVNIKKYNVYVESSLGVLDKPKLKKPRSYSWDDYHGEFVDLRHKFYEPRKITLDCFAYAESKNDFINNIIEFQELFDKRGTNRLTIKFNHLQELGDNNIPALCYEVYLEDTIKIKKKWDENQMLGTFTLKFIEPESIKMMYRFKATLDNNEVFLNVTSKKLFNIYWGDGSVDYDVDFSSSSYRGTIKHAYNVAQNSEFNVLIYGDIDSITSINSNAELIFRKF